MGTSAERFSAESDSTGIAAFFIMPEVRKGKTARRFSTVLRSPPRKIFLTLPTESTAPGTLNYGPGAKTNVMYFDGHVALMTQPESRQVNMQDGFYANAKVDWHE